MRGRLGQALVPLAAILAVAAGAVIVAPAQVGPAQAGPSQAGPSQAGPSPTASPVVRQETGAPYVRRQVTVGRSVRGRPIKAYYRGTPGAEHVLVVIGQMHGDERAGRVTAAWMVRHIRPLAGTGMWVLPTMNPDGDVRGWRVNARGVDLNRNWPTSGWTRAGRGSRYWGGPRRASEPETRAVMAFLAKVRPDYIASIHQPLRGIGRNDIDVAWERRLSSYLRLPRRWFGVGNPSGTVSPTMTGWYNRKLRRHGVATTIEYGARTTRAFRTRIAGRGIARSARVH